MKNSIDFSDAPKVLVSTLPEEVVKILIEEYDLEDTDKVPLHDLEGKLKFLPDYGWDGGNGISTHEVNLDIKQGWWIWGGPGVLKVEKEDSKKDAYVIYYYHGDNEIVVVKI